MNRTLAAPQAAFHDKVAELKEAFDLLDQAGDGFADAASIKSLMFTFFPGLSKDLLEKVLKAAKLDGLPNLTFAQFYVVATNVKSQLGLVFTAEETASFGELSQVFAPFDKSQSGSVDADVFFALMMEKGKKLSSREGAEMRSRLERMGFMKKGRVNYRAFLSYITSFVQD